MSPTLAFFGATGDCAGYCLAATLQAGIDCRALARTPAKLTKSMRDKGVSTELLDRNLTILEGNVRDQEAVKRVLELPDGRVVDQIVSGIGSLPTLQWSVIRPVILREPWVCRDAGATILSALAELKPAADNKPIIINISTTGISPKSVPRDIPIPYIPFYHWLLAEPHEDKQAMEQNLAAHVRLPEAQRGISGFVNVKPSLLMDGEALGGERVRQGVDEEPAIGYIIRKSDVGEWMAENLTKVAVKQEWANKSLSLTY